MEKINTLLIKINDIKNDIVEIKKAADILRNGGLVAFPTETVYGLGGNALNSKSVEKIYKAKGRPSDNPLIVHISKLEQLDKLTYNIQEKTYEVMEKFWPGPLTLVLHKSENVPDEITGGLKTVAIRMPNNEIALELISQTDLPIAAPSANTSGKPSPTLANHVIEDLNGRVEAIIDGGPTGIGVESTVLDVTGDIPVILRPGGITKEDLLSIYDEIIVDPALKDEKIIPKSPGMKYRHYSPKAQMKIIKGNLDNIIKEIIKIYDENIENNIKVGIMSTTQSEKLYGDRFNIVVGDRNNPETIARNLFKTLREFDNKGIDLILAEFIEEKGIGIAIMNRMEKAAGNDVVVIEN